MPSERDPASITFEIGSTFGATDAARLHEALARAAPGAPVELRFHRVRDWEASALAVLARDLLERGPSVAVHGLSEGQVRLLRHLGVDLSG